MLPIEIFKAPFISLSALGLADFFKKKYPNVPKILFIFFFFFIFTVVMHHLTKPNILDTIHKLRNEYNQPLELPATSDHINVIATSWIIANKITLELFKQFDDIMVIDIFINEKPSSVWLGLEHIEIFKNFLMQQNLTTAEKQAKYNSTIQRTIQHRAMMELGKDKYIAYNFYEKEPYPVFLEVIKKYKNQLFTKQYVKVPYKYGIYRMIINKKTKLIYTILERGGCQIQNYHTTADIKTTFTFPKQALTVNELINIDEGLFLSFLLENVPYFKANIL